MRYLQQQTKTLLPHPVDFEPLIGAKVIQVGSVAGYPDCSLEIIFEGEGGRQSLQMGWSYKVCPWIGMHGGAKTNVRDSLAPEWEPIKHLEGATITAMGMFPEEPESWGFDYDRDGERFRTILGATELGCWLIYHGRLDVPPPLFDWLAQKFGSLIYVDAWEEDPKYLGGCNWAYFERQALPRFLFTLEGDSMTRSYHFCENGFSKVELTINDLKKFPTQVREVFSKNWESFGYPGDLQAKEFIKQVLTVGGV